MRQLQRPHQVADVRERHVPALAQTSHIVRPVRLEDVHRAVRAERRMNPSSQARRLQPTMVLQAVHGVVRRAHRLDVEVLDEALLAHVRLRQPLPGAPPDVGRRVGRDQLVDAENALQVQMDPLVGGVAGDLLERRRHRHPLLLVGRLGAGQQLLRHAALAQHLPHIVVGRRLGVPDVREVAVLRQRPDVAVVVGIDDGQLPDALVQRLGLRPRKQVSIV